MKVETEGMLGTSAMVTAVRCWPTTGANMRPMHTKARAGRTGRTRLSSSEAAWFRSSFAPKHSAVSRKKPAGALKTRPLDLILEVAPDAVHDLAVARIVAQLQHVARPLQRYIDDGLGAARARGHHHDLVGERHRLVDAVGDEHQRLLVDLPDAQELLLQDGAVLLVERRERLVHQQDLGIVGKGARDRDALAHAAGELVGVVVREAGEAGAVEIAPDRFLDLPFGRLAHLEPIGRVLPDG